MTDASVGGVADPRASSVPGLAVFLVGLALAAAFWTPRTPIGRGPWLFVVYVGVPVAVAVLAYVRTRGAVSVLALVALAVWGVVAVVFALAATFFVAMDNAAVGQSLGGRFGRVVGGTLVYALHTAVIAAVYAIGGVFGGRRSTAVLLLTPVVQTAAVVALLAVA